jgi:hypothetical protein
MQAVQRVILHVFFCFGVWGAIPLTAHNSALSQHALAVATIFHNDAPYLKEWIEFHRLVGVEHFYLLNNMSTDNFHEIVDPYIAAGLVDLIEWPYDFPYGDQQAWNRVQLASYDHVLQLAQGRSTWVAFIDTDEFLFSPIADNLVEVLSKYKRFGGVAVNWLAFGTSGVGKVPEGTAMIEALILRATDNSRINLHVKSIVRPECVVGTANTPHYFIYRPGYFQVTTKKEKFQGSFSPSLNKDVLRINHYYLRDEDYFYRIKLPRWDQWGVFPNIPHVLEESNQVEDLEIARFIPELKKRLN